MRRGLQLHFIFVLMTASACAQQLESAAKATFRVQSVDQDTVSIDGGKDSGLTPGMTLTIKRQQVVPTASGEVKAHVVIATLKVVSVSSASATCAVWDKKSDIQRGDQALLLQADMIRLAQSRAAGAGRSEAQKITAPEPVLRATEPPAKIEVNKVPPAPSPSEPAATPVTAAKTSPSNPAVDLTSGKTVRSARQVLRESPPIPPPQESGFIDSAVVRSSPWIQNNPWTEPVQPKPVSPKTTVVATAQPPAKPAVMAFAPAAEITPAKTQSTTTAAQPPAPAVRASAPASETAPAKTQTTADTTQSPAPTVSTPAKSVPDATPVTVAANDVPTKTAFQVKYVAEDAVYIDGGKNVGLTEGMMLTISRSGVASTPSGNDEAKANNIVAELAVVSVSNTSAVCEIRQKTTDIRRGDVAVLSQIDQNKMVEARILSPDRKYPQVVAFSEGDPLDEEAREAVPKPPLPEVNRARGRFGMDYTSIRSTGLASASSVQLGAVARADITRLGGTYWNLNGYWRGRLNTRAASSQPQTVFDLVNRTYTMGLTYANPKSQWTAGVGRLFLPWATSLDTLDGGYLGRKFGSHVTIGAFAGTSPDPTSFDYNQDRRNAGTFVAFEGGSFEKLRFTSTEGVAVSAIEWREDRQFVFSENGLFYKRYISIYHSMQADIQRLPLGGTTEGLSRSFATLRLQPFSRLSFDVNHNYFRDVPTFDPLLVGTGLLDKFLFQGLSAGARLDLPGRISLYNNFGQSSKSGDTRSAYNQLYGVTLGRLWKTGIRADARYSKFTSTFGQGEYRALAVSRSFSEMVRIEVNAGKQTFLSSLSTPTNYRLLGSVVDLNLGRHYFIESGLNLQRSQQLNLDQWLVTAGYRFDTGGTK